MYPVGRAGERAEHGEEQGKYERARACRREQWVACGRRA